MIGMIRTGKNPTMRHLERTHGISIGWMHSIFQEGYVSLAYEVTAKDGGGYPYQVVQGLRVWDPCVSADQHFPPSLIGSQEIMDLMRPTHAQSADEKGHQHYSFKSEVPWLPLHTHIASGAVSGWSLQQEGLQEHDSVDPILVVRFPCVLREPPSALPPGRYLRSTWILHEGQWHQVEDHAQMPDTPAKFDRYVERAVFQFHPVRDQLRPADVSEASVPLPSPPLGQHFVCATACQMAVRGSRMGVPGLPLRFNGRPYSHRTPYVGGNIWLRKT